MAKITRFLVFGLQLSVSRALNCPSPFTDIRGVCLNSSSSRKTWCDAQAFCSSVGGELLRGSSFLPFDGRAASSLPERHWIGLTDLLIERKKSKSGWRWSDGALDPLTSGLVWNSPPTFGANDCIRRNRAREKISDSPCFSKRHAVCQPKSLSSSVTRFAGFRAVSIPVGLPANSFAEGGGCAKLRTKVSSKVECARVCMFEPMETCVAIYFNEASKKCRLVLFTDATVDMGAARGWKKFVMT